MTTLTQKIPNLLRGISQQPDPKKFPGEVRDCVNAFPEYALGLMKRPGAKLEAPLRRPAVPSGSLAMPAGQTAVTRHYGATEKWFDINVDGVPYVGQINDYSYSDNAATDKHWISFNLWFKNSGLPRAVKLDEYMASSYISSGSWSTHQSAIDAEATDLSAKITALSTFQTAQKAYYTEYLKTVDQLTDLFAIDTTYTNGNVKQFVNSAVLVDNDGNEDYIRAGNTMTGTLHTTDTTVGDVIFKTGEFREGSDAAIAYKKGVEKTSEYPILMDSYPTGYKLYELLKIDKATDEDEADLGGTPTTTYNTAQTTYDTAVTTYNDEVDDTDESYPTFDTSKQPKTGTSNYFVDDVAGGSAKVDLSKLKIFTFQDTTFILNPNKKVEYTSDTTTVPKFDEAFIFFKVLSDGDFTVTLTLLSNDSSGNEPHEAGYTRTVDTSFGSSGVIDATSTHGAGSGQATTLEEHRQYLAAGFVADYSNFGSHFDFDISANGIYIKSKSTLANRQFEIAVTGPTDDSISSLRHEVTNVSDLPIQVKNNYIVKVVNSLDANADDFYVKYETEDGSDYTPGAWVETTGPNIKYIIDKNTMPHALTVNTDGSFSFGPWESWENRLVGDELTNPTPHFITIAGGSNRYIKDMFVYRNRLGFLTEDYVSLSRAGEFFNFFVKSALASGDDDPIDISVSDRDSPSLNYVSKEAAGLLLYGKTGQYLLATDSDILSPTTAKINKVAGFEADMENPAITLGATTAFISKTQSTTKLHELLKVSALESPQHIEQTRTVPELVPTTVDSIVGSPDVGIVSFGTIGETTLYHFSYLRIGNQEINRSWYKWELPGTLLHQFFDGNEFHCIVKTNQNEVAVVSFDVAQSSTDGVLTLESGKKTDLVLDLYDDKPFFIYRGIVSGTFENKTRVFLPLNKLSDKKLVIVMYSNRSQVFDEDTVTLTEGTDATHGRYVEVDGDWRGSDVFIGYKYNMSVELPRIYYKTARDQQVNADVEAELIIHKLQVKTGLTGPIDYKINIIGVPVRTSKLTVTPVGQYNLNSVNMTESAVHHVPVYQRNHNTTITIESNTAFPATVESINWEGRYATNYYRRA